MHGALAGKHKGRAQPLLGGLVVPGATGAVAPEASRCRRRRWNAASLAWPGTGAAGAWPLLIPRLLAVLVQGSKLGRHEWPLQLSACDRLLDASRAVLAPPPVSLPAAAKTVAVWRLRLPGRRASCCRLL